MILTTILSKKQHYFCSCYSTCITLTFDAGEETHKIPADERGLAGEEDTYRSVWMELLNFVNPEKKTVFPPVYCRVSKPKL